MDDDLVIKAVENDDELHSVNDLMIKIHYGDYYEGMQWIESTGASFPDFRREHNRMAILDGQLAGALRITSHTIRIGEARLRMGGFGWVSTNPQYRKRGVARELIKDSLLYMKAYVLTDAKGKVFAYFIPRLTDNEFILDESGAWKREDCAALVHACASMAHDGYRARLRFVMPPEHCISRFLMQYRSTHETRLTREEGGMLAPVNMLECLESMLPEWENQLQLHNLTTNDCEVSLYIDKRSYRLRSHHGVIDITDNFVGKNRVGLTQQNFIHLLTGYRFLDDVLAERRRILTPDGRALLSALFPKRSPFVWPIDRF